MKTCCGWCWPRVFLRGLLVSGDQLVLLDPSDLLADQALRGHLDQLERRESLWVFWMCSSNLVCPANDEYQLLISLFLLLRVRKGPLAQQVGTGCRVLWVCPALLEQLEFLARTETRPVTLSNRDHTLAKLLRIFKKLQGECFTSAGGAWMSRVKIAQSVK